MLDFNNIPNIFEDADEREDDAPLTIGKIEKVKIRYSWIKTAEETMAAHLAADVEYDDDPYFGYGAGLDMCVELPADVCERYKNAAAQPLMLWGKLVGDGDGMRFVVCLEYKTKPVVISKENIEMAGVKLPSEMTLRVKHYNKCLTPVFQYCVKRKYYVKLMGEPDYTRRVFAVKNLLFGSGSTFKSISDKTTSEEDPRQPLLRRIIRNCLAPETREQSIGFFSSTVYSTIIEFTLLLEFLGDKYPPEVIRLAKRCLAQYRYNTLGIDEKKHAVKALSYLLNVNWLGELFDMPELDEVKRVLDEEFVGLQPVKRRILEVVAQIKMTGKLPERSILLCGPAGVGKTAIVNAICRILRRPSTKLDINALGDGDSMSGSSRIYSNAKPGVILDRIYAARTANIIMELSELDKAAEVTTRLSPMSVLLSLVERNGFIDNFIEGPVPTDKMLFVATCNEPEKLSKPLLDRFLRIDIPAYSRAEKREILVGHSIPTLLSNMGIPKGDLLIDEAAIDLICNGYAVKPGVRDLVTFAERIVSDYIYNLLQHGTKRRVYTTTAVRDLLGPEVACRRELVTYPGMAIVGCTNSGSVNIVSVEASVSEGTGKLTVLNAPGEITADYCTAAYCCMKRAVDFDFSKHDVTLLFLNHLPDCTGNQFGIAVYAAILSAITKREYSADVAFLGGCDLVGNTYFDDTNLDPYLEALAAAGIKTIYAPHKSGRLTFECRQSIDVIEAMDVHTLIRLAIGNARSTNTNI